MTWHVLRVLEVGKGWRGQYWGEVGWYGVGWGVGVGGRGMRA